MSTNMKRGICSHGIFTPGSIGVRPKYKKFCNYPKNRSRIHQLEIRLWNSPRPPGWSIPSSPEKTGTSLEFWKKSLQKRPRTRRHAAQRVDVTLKDLRFIKKEETYNYVQVMRNVECRRQNTDGSRRQTLPDHISQHVNISEEERRQIISDEDLK